MFLLFFFSSRRRHTRWPRDWSSDVCSSDLPAEMAFKASLPSGGEALVDRMLAADVDAVISPGRDSVVDGPAPWAAHLLMRDRKSTRLNSSHVAISYAVFCLKKKTAKNKSRVPITNR